MNGARERVMVPHWTRGAELLELVAPRRQRLPMLGLRADTPDKLDKAAVQRCVAVMAYIAADIEQALSR